jgi:hypothetical protein
MDMATWVRPVLLAAAKRELAKHSGKGSDACCPVTKPLLPACWAAAYNPRKSCISAVLVSRLAQRAAPAHH